MILTETVRVRLTPGDRSGYLRESDLTVDTFAGLDWSQATPGGDRRVIVDVGSVTRYGPGVVERVARALVDAGAGRVQVEGSRKPRVRAAFYRGLREAVTDASGVLG
jgi:hypothetical protein